MNLPVSRAGFLYQKFTAIGVLPVFFAIIVPVCFAVSYVLLRPDLNLDAVAYLFHDQGANFFVADRILKGFKLYADFFYQYGPLAIYPYAGLAKIFGNDPNTFLVFLIGVSGINFCLAFLLLRKMVSSFVVSAVVVLGLIPTLLVPGPGTGALTNSTYIPLERTLLLLIGLVWCDPSIRSRSRAVTLGLLLGVCQTVRFGVCFPMMAAILCLDAVLLIKERTNFRNYADRAVFLLAGFAFAESLRSAYLFLLLPREIAWDTMWPAYFLKAYTTPLDVRWPQFDDLKGFLLRQFTPAVGLLLSALGLVQFLKAKGPEPCKGRQGSHGVGIFLFPIFYVLGATFYFRHVFHFQQFAWTLVIAAGFAVDRFRVGKKVLVTFLALPGFLLCVKIIFWNPIKPDFTRVTVPSGGALWASKAFIQDVTDLLGRLDALGSAMGSKDSPVMFCPLGAGLHYFYSVPQNGRVYWYMPEVVRPYDQPDFLASMGRAKAVVFSGDHSGTFVLSDDPCLWPSRPFPKNMCGELGKILIPRGRIGKRFWLFENSRVVQAINLEPVPQKSTPDG